MLEIGIKGRLSETVTEEKTAGAVGSGALPVYATPAMIALMEHTALLSVAPELDEGMTTVGTKLDVAHTSASPVGSTITCESELVETDRRRLVFKVTAYDDAGEIGSGTHERFIVDCGKFMEKTAAKLNK
ncbi:MAG: thioesterase family protein [Ruminiclostridium sp.]|nr:thioesterase family protein [Ruminiclostridium sp.]